MYTIEDYLLWRGDLTFEQSPFNDVDAGILARFSYEPMDGIVSSDHYDKKRLKDVCAELLNKPDLPEYVIDKTLDPKFIWEISNCRRFEDIMLSGYVNEISLETQTQFSAVLCDINGEGDYFLAFRGTDSTLIGWKEDFNMAFEFPVPAQSQALEYLEKTMRKFKDGTFMVGGHSKGGNLSIYSCSFCGPEYRRAITKVYNFDGPGFTKDLMDTTEGYKEISSRIYTFVPRFSVVGLLLEHEEDYEVVDSNESGLMQHEILSWGVEALHFDYVEELDKSSRFLDATLKDWLKKIGKEEREQFVESIYGLIEASNAGTVDEFSQNRNEALTKMLVSYSKMDNESKAGLKNTVKHFMDSAVKIIKK